MKKQKNQTSHCASLSRSMRSNVLSVGHGKMCMAVCACVH